MYYYLTPLPQTTSTPPPPFQNLLSLEGNGSDQYVGYGDVLGFDRLDPFSISAWVKPTADTTAHVIAGKWDATLSKGYLLYFNTNRFLLILRNTSLTNEIVAQTAQNFPENNWYSVVVTYDGSSSGSGIHIWVNGVDVPITVSPDNLSASITTSVEFCLLRAVDNFYFKGLIDEVAIWNDELDATSVAAIYNSGSPANLLTTPQSSALVSWWRFEDYLVPPDTGMVIYDRKGSNNGTPVNIDNTNFSSDVP